VRAPVRFAAGMATLAAEGVRTCLEIGPQPTLLALGQRGIADDGPTGAGPAGVGQVQDWQWLASLRRGTSEVHQMLESLAALYVRGVAIDWRAAQRGQGHLIPDLPTYPFQRQPFQIRATGSPDTGRRSTRPAQHPLLGTRLSSALPQTQFEAVIGTDTHPWLADHRVFGATVLPAASYLEMALAAGIAQLELTHLVIEGMVIERPLLLDEGPRTVQTVLTPHSDGSVGFDLFAKEERADREAWVRHATARLRPAPEALLPRLPEHGRACSVDVDTYYQRLTEQGLEYGPAFRGIEKLWRDTAGIAAQLRIPEPAVQKPGFHLHPVLLDSSFQLSGVILADQAQDECFFPIAVERLRFIGTPTSKCRAYARVKTEGKSVLADVVLFNDAGETFAVLHGLRLRRTRRETWARIRQNRPQAETSVATSRLTDALYKVTWCDLPWPEAQTSRKVRRWLIIAGTSVEALALARRLEQTEQSGQTDSCLLASSRVTGPGTIDGVPVDRADDATLSRLIRESAWTDIVDLRAADRAASAGDGPRPLDRSLPLLVLVQAVAAHADKQPPRLWLLTRGAQPVAASGVPIDFDAAAVWGLRKVIALEYPELRATAIDLDPTDNSARAVADIHRELAGDSSETEVGFRGGRRLAARLSGYAPAAGERQDQPARLDIATPGMIDTLSWKPLERRAPAPGTAEIAVRAAGINFRDILNALNLYPGDAGPLGGECAGTVVAVGPDTAGLRVGDPVMAIAPGGCATHVLTDARLVVAKPERLSFEQAAAIPIAYATAAFALERSACLRPGTKVLIHAASGGVGMAAIELARFAGAEILATASPSKWPILHALGVGTIMNSRTLDFRQEVMRVTGGRGVDVVLNSLSGDWIPASLAVVAPQGRFIEIGKRQIWDAVQVAAVRPDVDYTIFDLAEVARDEPVRVREVLRSVCSRLDNGSLPPLPVQAFAREDVVPAFRTMAQARHTGKLVLRTDPDGLDSGHSLRSDRTYLVTGGFGSLGIQAATRLVAGGARHLLLIGRSSPNQAAESAITAMRHTGAQVVAAQADVADPQALAGAMAEIGRSLPPLAGVIHAAGVLNDGPLVDQTAERFGRVMGPKVMGAWNLHLATRESPLDFFVLFSSAAAILGSPAQGNYAAANAVLDALAHERRRRGLPALSIDWSAWEGAGMASSGNARIRSVMTRQGFALIRPEPGLELLEKLVLGARGQIAVLPVDWARFAAAHPGNAPPALLRNLVAADTTPTAPAVVPQLLPRLQAVSPARRRALLFDHVQDEVRKVLGLDPSHPIDPQQGLTDLGMDSLMAVELRARLQASTGHAMPATVAFEHPTVAAIVDHIAAELLPQPQKSQPAPVAQPRPEAAVSAGTIDLDGLSEEEVEVLLANRLALLKAGSQSSGDQHQGRITERMSE